MPCACFDEVLFPVEISRGALGGPQFSTVVVDTSSGDEQRIAYWSQGRRKWDVAHSPRNANDMEALLDFFLVRQGRLRGFRFKDWMDYRSYVAGVETKHNLVEITATTFQLVKRYTSGSLTHIRNIQKPVSNTLGDTAATQANSTVKIYNGGTEITSGWTINCTTGIVTFSADPAYTPSATFEFHVPCRFDTDIMNVRQDDVAVRSWDGIPILEIRV